MPEQNQHSTPHDIAEEYAAAGYVMEVADKSAPYCHPDSVSGRQTRLGRAYLSLEEQLEKLESEKRELLLMRGFDEWERLRSLEEQLETTERLREGYYVDAQQQRERAERADEQLEALQVENRRLRAIAESGLTIEQADQLAGWLAEIDSIPAMRSPS